jgi:hypothetical protein
VPLGVLCDSRVHPLRQHASGAGYRESRDIPCGYELLRALEALRGLLAALLADLGLEQRQVVDLLIVVVMMQRRHHPVQQRGELLRARAHALELVQHLLDLLQPRM